MRPALPRSADADSAIADHFFNDIGATGTKIL
jgi:hypothetical protein